MSAAKVELSHYSRGRLRLKARALKGDRREAERIRGALEGLPSITEVSANHVTGSLLIRFSPNALAPVEASRCVVDALTEIFPEAFAGPFAF